MPGVTVCTEPDHDDTSADHDHDGAADHDDDPERRFHPVVRELGRSRAGTGTQPGGRWAIDCGSDRVSQLLVRGRTDQHDGIPADLGEWRHGKRNCDRKLRSNNTGVGRDVTVSLAPGSPGQLLELSVAGQGEGGTFCNSTSAGQCGA